jgi:hypothetical protein
MISLMAKDPNEFARGILDTIIAKHDPEALREQGRNPAAVARGMRGGAKGGPARAKKLTASKRKSIAQKAAQSRWKKKP